MPLDNIAFSLQSITRNSDNYFKNIKAMVLDNKGSDYSYGTDTISLNFFKSLKPEVWDMIGDIVNIIFVNGYRKFFRNHKFVAILKKSIVSELKHLRPVGVSNSWCNIVEKVFTKQFTHHAEENDFFS